MQDLDAERAKTKDYGSPLGKFHMDGIPANPRVQDGSTARNEGDRPGQVVKLPPCAQVLEAERTMTKDTDRPLDKFHLDEIPRAHQGSSGKGISALTKGSPRHQRAHQGISGKGSSNVAFVQSHIQAADAFAASW